MRVIQLVKTGPAAQAFAEREMPDPHAAPGEVRIAVEAFGLNYADVVARHGLYQDAPPLPSVLGYEVVGRIDEVGSDVADLRAGMRVCALTRFGGYATSAVTDARAVVEIADDMDAGAAVALPTQGCTAWFMAEEMVRLHPGDHVLVHAAAGGVGVLLVQMCVRRGCVVCGTAGSAAKLDLLRELGVAHPINYRTADFVEAVRQLRGSDGLDVIFDSIGGASVRRGIPLLAAGGRMVCFGAASHASGPLQILRSLRFLLSWGFPHPIPLLIRSRSLIGVNMLRISDERPLVLQRCLQAVAALASAGELRTIVGGSFINTEIAAAHDLLESRNSVGKIVVRWS